MRTRDEVLGLLVFTALMLALWWLIHPHVAFGDTIIYENLMDRTLALDFDSVVVGGAGDIFMDSLNPHSIDKSVAGNFGGVVGGGKGAYFSHAAIDSSRNIVGRFYIKGSADFDQAATSVVFDWNEADGTEHLRFRVLNTEVLQYRVTNRSGVSGAFTNVGTISSSWHRVDWYMWVGDVPGVGSSVRVFWDGAEVDNQISDLDGVRPAYGRFFTDFDAGDVGHLYFDDFAVDTTGVDMTAGSTESNAALIPPVTATLGGGPQGGLQ